MGWLWHPAAGINTFASGCKLSVSRTVEDSRIDIYNEEPLHVIDIYFWSLYHVLFNFWNFLWNHGSNKNYYTALIVSLTFTTILSLKTQSIIHWAESIECNREIGLKTPPVNRVHVIRRTLVHSGVHLRCRIYLYLGFHLVLSYVPLVYLHSNENFHHYHHHSIRGM